VRERLIVITESYIRLIQTTRRGGKAEISPRDSDLNGTDNDLTTNDSNNYTQKKGLDETQRELKSN